MRWFTYCRPGAYSPPVGTASGADRYLGLLFGTDSEEEVLTLSDADQLVIHPDIQKMYGNGCAALIVDINESERCILVASTVNAFKRPDALPDVANDSTPVFIVGIGNQRFEYNLVDRYNACTSLIKYMGCSNCDLKGYACTREAIPFLPEFDAPDKLKLTEKSAPKIDSFRKYKSGVTQINDFTFVAPTLTHRYGRNSALRGWKLHTFRAMDRIEDERKARSERTATKRNQRQFELAQCNRCFVQSHCTSRNFRQTCTGALPAEEIAYSDMRKETDYLLRANFTEAQIRDSLARCHDAENLDADGLALKYSADSNQWRLCEIAARDVTEKRTWSSYSEASKALGWAESPVPDAAVSDEHLLIALCYVHLQKEDDTRVLLGVHPSAVMVADPSPYYGYLHARSISSIGSLFYEYDRLPGVTHGRYRDVP
jgi:hypothetical protein